MHRSASLGRGEDRKRRGGEEGEKQQRSASGERGEDREGRWEGEIAEVSFSMDRRGEGGGTAEVTFSRERKKWKEGRKGWGEGGGVKWELFSERLVFR